MRPPVRASSVRSQALTASLLRRWPLPSLGGAGSKDDRGRVLVIGGSDELPGSLLLAAEAALRAGAGKLQAATVRTVSATLAVGLPEAKVMALPARAGAIARATTTLLEAARHADAVLVGCGMDDTAATRRLVRELRRVCRCPLVLDAGALINIRRGTKAVAPIIMTPHLGEMAALTGLDRDFIKKTQAEVATTYAREHGVFIALKGAATVVAEPGGENFPAAQRRDRIGNLGFRRCPRRYRGRSARARRGSRAGFDMGRVVARRSGSSARQTGWKRWIPRARIASRNPGCVGDAKCIAFPAISFAGKLRRISRFCATT